MDEFCPAPIESQDPKTRLLQSGFWAIVSRMSAVELAIIRVKKLSTRQARELLSWLDARQTKESALKPRPKKARRKTTARQRMKELKAWEDSVRLTTDWEPPRMPDDLVKPYPL